MLVPSPSVSMAGTRQRDNMEAAESLFRTKPISEIRNVEAATRDEIRAKSEELRQLVGNRYRDLIDSADSIVLMKSSCESISANISAIRSAITDSLTLSFSSSITSLPSDPSRFKMYGIACRVKYLVDTPENIWGCLDEEFMLLEAASSRYVRAKQVHHSLIDKGNEKSILSNFPLLQHQWQIVQSFKLQISQRSRERLLALDHNHTLSITAYANPLAAVAVVDELHPKQVLSLFLDSRKSCISQILSNCSNSKATTSSDVIKAFCEVVKIVQVTLGQAGELFLDVVKDMPLFYKVILGSPPASQLFGSIPDPHEEVRLWKLFRDKLESVMVMLDRDYVATTCSAWLKNCGKEVVNEINGRYLIDSIGSGQELASAEKLLRETMESKQVLEGSLEWLKSVFGSEIKSLWNSICELVLGDQTDLWNEIFEDAFFSRMKAIIDFGYNSLSTVVNVRKSIDAIVVAPGKRADLGGGVWFLDHSKKGGPLTGYKTLPEENDLGSCLNAYFGAEVGGITDAIDSCCRSVLEDLLSFLDSPKASFRLKDLASYIQTKCYQSILFILTELKSELEHLSFAIDTSKGGIDSALSPAKIVERSLFIGRVMFALQKHSKHIPIIFGSPKQWSSDTKNGVYGNQESHLRHSSIGMNSPISDSPRRNKPDLLKWQYSLAATTLFREDDSSSSQLEELYNVTSDLSIRAHNLWISWVSDVLSEVLSCDLRQDDGLSASSPLRGWEDTVVKQQQSDERQSEMKISLPSMPSLYITSFLFHACEEIQRVGGHVLDKQILQKLALRLLEKVIKVYSDIFLTAEAQESQMSDKGVLQILLDLRFVADVLSGGDSVTIDQISKKSKPKFSFRRNQDVHETKSVIRTQVDDLVNRFSKTLDPIDWLTYELYLWENEKQSYLRHAVLFGFFVHLNRMYTDTVKKLPSNSESNIMRCSTVPRFEYLPISAPALSSRGTGKASVSTPIDDVSSRSSWNGLANDELPQDMDDESSLMAAAPFLKSFMQVGSRFGESTLKLGSMLTDGQVGRFKDKSAASMFGDMLPSQAAGLLSSFTAAGSDP